ncbi:hypothetical protein Gotur_010432 [Gossypium turneri]
MKSAVISVFVMLAMFQFVVKQGQAAVTCKQVNDALAACVPYLTNGGVPSTPCCNGVGELRTSAVTTADRQAACNCVKQAAARIPTIKEDDAATLPAKCHVQVDFPISKNTNCEDFSGNMILARILLHLLFQNKYASTAEGKDLLRDSPHQGRLDSSNDNLFSAIVGLLTFRRGA